MELQTLQSHPAIRQAAFALAVRGPLAVFISTLEAGVARAERVGDSDEERDGRRRVVLTLLNEIHSSSQVDTIDVFEKIMNSCLSLGYRAQPLAAFAFGVLASRFAGRIRRRLFGAGFSPSPEDVADLVGTSAETLARLIRDAKRSEYTLRYALLLSLADHRAIDFIRAGRRRPESPGLPEEDGHGAPTITLWGDAGSANPEAALATRQRVAVANGIREAIFLAVNGLPHRERAALIAVELDGAGYPEVAAALSLSPTDVGNVVRRARLLRDRALLPRLRALPGLAGHVGFSELQVDRDLRLHMLRWSVEMGHGVCEGCARRAHLHEVERACPGDA